MVIFLGDPQDFSPFHPYMSIVIDPVLFVYAAISMRLFYSRLPVILAFIVFLPLFYNVPWVTDAAVMGIYSSNLGFPWSVVCIVSSCDFLWWSLLAVEKFVSYETIHKPQKKKKKQMEQVVYMCACMHSHKSTYVKIIVKKGIWEGLEGRKGEWKWYNYFSIKIKKEIPKPYPILLVSPFWELFHFTCAFFTSFEMCPEEKEYATFSKISLVLPPNSLLWCSSLVPLMPSPFFLLKNKSVLCFSSDFSLMGKHTEPLPFIYVKCQAWHWNSLVVFPYIFKQWLECMYSGDLDGWGFRGEAYILCRDKCPH